MASVGLVLGGARSGKSRYACDLALRLSARPAYVATSRRWDEEHQRRIQRHLRERDPAFRTVEEERQLSRVAGASDVLVVDCVTLWLTNFFVDANEDAESALVAAKREFDAALAASADAEARWVFVSNELGQGPHAMTEAGRKFTDVQGFMNQYAASRADWVVLMVAGIPMNVKGTPP